MKKLNIRFVLASRALWAPEGYEVAWAQFPLPPASAESRTVTAAGPAPASADALHIERNGAVLELVGTELRAEFDLAAGRLRRWDHRGRRIVHLGPRLTERQPSDGPTS